MWRIYWFAIAWAIQRYQGRSGVFATGGQFDPHRGGMALFGRDSAIGSQFQSVRKVKIFALYESILEKFQGIFHFFGLKVTIFKHFSRSILKWKFAQKYWIFSQKFEISAKNLDKILLLSTIEGPQFFSFSDRGQWSLGPPLATHLVDAGQVGVGQCD